MNYTEFYLTKFADAAAEPPPAVVAPPPQVPTTEEKPNSWKGFVAGGATTGAGLTYAALRKLQQFGNKANVYYQQASAPGSNPVVAAGPGAALDPRYGKMKPEDWREIAGRAWNGMKSEFKTSLKGIGGKILSSPYTKGTGAALGAEATGRALEAGGLNPAASYGLTYGAAGGALANKLFQGSGKATAIGTGVGTTVGLGRAGIGKLIGDNKEKQNDVKAQNYDNYIYGGTATPQEIEAWERIKSGYPKLQPRTKAVVAPATPATPATPPAAAAVPPPAVVPPPAADKPPGTPMTPAEKAIVGQR